MYGGQSCTVLICDSLQQPPSRFDELPEELDANGKIPGSFDDGDPQTTNLYVGNLSPQVCLERLFMWKLRGILRLRACIVARFLEQRNQSNDHLKCCRSMRTFS